MERQCQGCHPTDMDWKKHDSMFLSEQHVWYPLDLNSVKGKRRQVEHFHLPTAATRDSWMSPLAHWHYKFAKPDLFDDNSKRTPFDLDQQIDLAFIGAYQSSYTNAFTVFEDLWKTNREIEYPFIEFLKASNDEFGTMVGGKEPRFQTPGVKFNEIFLSDDGCTRLKIMRKGLKTLLESANELMVSTNVELTKHGKIPIDEIRKLISKANNDLKDVAVWKDSTEGTDDEISAEEKKLHKSELGEFQLMLFLQACALCQTVIKPNKRIHDFFYPAKGLASMKHILSNINDDKCRVSDEEIDEIMDEVASSVGIIEWKRSMMETLFCESFDTRGEKRFDLFFRGQWLFRLEDNGSVMCKRYNNLHWEKLVL